MTNPNWKWRPLGELFDIGAGKTMSAAARIGADKVPFLRTSNVLWDEIDLSEVDEMSISAAELAGKNLVAGDLLVCEGGEIGRAAVWDGRVPVMSFQNHLHRLRPIKDDVDAQFYVYFLQSAFTQLGIFEGAGNKTTIPNLSRNRLAALDVPHPPLAEQKSIARSLAKAREAISVHNKATSIALELKHAVMNHLFTRGLRREAQKETEIGLVPESWDIVPLGSLGRIGNGSTPKKSVRDYWEGGTFPWLTSAKVYDRDIEAAGQFVTKTALDECHLPILKPGAVLIAITGQGKTLGHCAVLRIEATINQHVAYLQTDTTEADPGFIRGYLETQYDYLRQVAAGGGSTKGALTCAFLRSLPLPLPGIEEQHEIVAVLDAIDRKIDLHRKKRSVLEELFKSLLHKLITGEISVSDMDLSVLLSASTQREEVAA
ncbi:restriction endonuclease subunit S [Burkholderia pseudomallei]|uniref:restriction endonuclease subunit S n=1 Tax=Burkholderia pseudomallei TaxID=28450 RepID=UPI00071808E2|nr:restriction endonuclease subunit S [Burkholderia pseudomallei]ONA40303.1 restriction endonuclease [Burkholderia pseudomallei]